MKPALAALLSLLLTACSDPPPPPLPKLNLDVTRVSVAGFSSGAAMAHQVHLAYADRLSGAAMLAGPPYHCAQGDLDTALATCLRGAPDARALAGVVRERAGTVLAPLEALAGDRVFIAHGSEDAVVAPAVAQSVRDVYADLREDVAFSLDYWGDGRYAHVFPTVKAGGDCFEAAPPYLGNCGRDFAGMMMISLHGEPTAPLQQSATGTLSRFDQTAYVEAGRDPSLADTGFLYVPTRCAAGERCGLLVVFHGCEQNADAVGEAFVRDAGFNRWADVQDVVVLYPQTQSSYVPLNPKACWDWWGYTGADYDTRDGAQLRWLANATAALGAPLR